MIWNKQSLKSLPTLKICIFSQEIKYTGGRSFIRNIMYKKIVII